MTDEDTRRDKILKELAEAREELAVAEEDGSPIIAEESRQRIHKLRRALDAMDGWEPNQ